MPPLVDKHSFLFKDILGDDPTDALKFCKSLQNEWAEKYSKDPELAMRMKEFKKTHCLHLVCVSDKFGVSVPEDIGLSKAYSSYCPLSKAYDQRKPFLITADDNPGYSQPTWPHSDAESDRNSEKQLYQHFNALLHLFNAAEAQVPLSEELIKYTHGILMSGLYGDGSAKINAGEYRLCPVGTGMKHMYPEFDIVPTTMERIIREYKERCTSREHHTFELASWLLYELLTIHPFEDGNGRVSRLLWCYSLLRDGLPFPVTPFPGHKKAYKKYIWCINRDREISGKSLTPNCKHLTSLTLISITMTWKKFVLNLESESPEKYKEILEMLKESGNILPSLDE